MNNVAKDRTIKMLEHYLKQVQDDVISTDMIIIYNGHHPYGLGIANWAGLSYDKKHEMLTKAAQFNAEWKTSSVASGGLANV